MSFGSGKIWKNGTLVDWADATIHIGAHVAHYGSGVFEGARCYDTPRGSACLRLDAHIRRLYDSAKVFRMTYDLSPEDFEAAVLDTLRHEAAHALAWEHDRETGHGPAWRKWCRVTGARPVRCYDGETAMPEPKYQCTVLATEAVWSMGSGANQQTGVARTRLAQGAVFGRHLLDVRQ